MTIINFIFTRHGYGCHNAIRPLTESSILTSENFKKMKNSLKDPELTKIGVEATIGNGRIISDILTEKLNINNVNIVGCSTLIRSMESAYYMTRKWENPPEKIYVFPLLREIDESSSNKYSVKSRLTMDNTDSYAMKTIQEQKEYLKSINILEYFDFTFCEKKNFIHLRKEPGDIKIFTQWFINIFLPLNKLVNKNLNILIVTHAGVLRDFSHQGFNNNSGFLLESIVTNNGSITYKNLIPFNTLLTKSFIKDYYNYSKNDYCPSTRCGQLCDLI